MELQKSKRKNSRLKIGLSGASGYGKSYSSLLLAYGLSNDWSKIAVIDTENGSSNLYAHLGEFNVLDLKPPYSPDNYINAINTCENAAMEVIIIDSITNEWKGVGGCLEMHNKLGGRFQDWGKITPKHQLFIDALHRSKCHIITTVRRRIEYVVDTDDNGRFKVSKLGTKEETRNGFEYELTINFELMNDQHVARATKDRTGLFTNRPSFIINKSTGQKLAAWCSAHIELNGVTEISAAT